MTRSLPPNDKHDPRGGYVVRKPRASDAIGGSLRNIYETDPQVPSDLTALIRRIDGRCI